MTTDPLALSALLAELALRQLPCGGWAALASSSQPAIEPTCYSALALGSVPAGDIEHAQDFLLHDKILMGLGQFFAEALERFRNHIRRRRQRRLELQRLSWQR